MGDAERSRIYNSVLVTYRRSQESN